MNNQQIFKLIFLHDQRLDELAQRGQGLSESASIEDFMRPDPTYSKLYFTGTNLEKEAFGLSVLDAYDKVIHGLDSGLENVSYQTASSTFSTLNEAIESIEIGEVIVIGASLPSDLNIQELHLDDNSNAGHIKSTIRSFLEKDLILVFKEKAHDGFDLHFFSKANIYRNFFFNLQKLVPDHFRFFSINGKRMRSERHFYFETWTLNQPPHGFEEVFPESVL